MTSGHRATLPATSVHDIQVTWKMSLKLILPSSLLVKPVVTPLKKTRHRKALPISPRILPNTVSRSGSCISTKLVEEWLMHLPQLSTADPAMRYACRAGLSNPQTSSLSSNNQRLRRTGFNKSFPVAEPVGDDHLDLAVLSEKIIAYLGTFHPGHVLLKSKKRLGDLVQVQLLEEITRSFRKRCWVSWRRYNRKWNTVFLPTLLNEHDILARWTWH